MKKLDYHSNLIRMIDDIIRELNRIKSLKEPGELERDYAKTIESAYDLIMS